MRTWLSAITLPMTRRKILRRRPAYCRNGLVHRPESAQREQRQFCRVVRFPRRIATPALALRLARLWELPALYSLFSAEVFERSTGHPGRPFYSLLSFWRWLREFFCVVYLLELVEAGERRVIGFVGLSDLKIGRSVGVSMAIFDPADRRRGYGGQSLELLCCLLGTKAIARIASAEVRRDNPASLGFLRAVQFAVRGERDGLVTLERLL
jgi:RimJ/RimL family protein N-acetyltransferase